MMGIFNLISGDGDSDNDDDDDNDDNDDDENIIKGERKFCTEEIRIHRVSLKVALVFD